MRTHPLPYVLSLSFLGVFTPLALFAAEITILPVNTAIIETGEFQTKVLVDTGNESINTFAGTIVFPPNLLTLKEIRTGSSIINYWVEEPTQNNNTVTFAGMTPGGFTGSNGTLLTLVFTATDEGKGTIQVQNPLFLKNDGQGTAAKMAVKSAFIQVLPSDQRRDITVPDIEDHEPPAPFTLEITKNPVLLQGVWVAIFAAQDNDSGINHYEKRECTNAVLCFFSPWIRTESPTPLLDQSGKSHTYVKAVDNAGNFRVAHARPAVPSPWFMSLPNWFIIIGILVLTAGLLIPPFQRVWRKR